MPYPSNFPIVSHVHNFTDTLPASYNDTHPQIIIVLIWILSAIVFYIMRNKEPELELEPEPEQKPDNENDWKPVGIYRDYSTYTTHLLYRHKDTRVWRFRNRKGYVYPEKKDLALYGTRLT